MANLRLKTNDDGKVSGLCLDGVEAMTSSDGSFTFYADKLYEVNPKTGEKVEIRPTDNEGVQNTPNTESAITTNTDVFKTVLFLAAFACVLYIYK